MPTLKMSKKYLLDNTEVLYTGTEAMLECFQLPGGTFVRMPMDDVATRVSEVVKATK